MNSGYGTFAGTGEAANQEGRPTADYCPPDYDVCVGAISKCKDLSLDFLVLRDQYLEGQLSHPAPETHFEELAATVLSYEEILQSNSWIFAMGTPLNWNYNQAQQIWSDVRYAIDRLAALHNDIFNAYCAVRKGIRIQHPNQMEHTKFSDEIRPIHEPQIWATSPRPDLQQ